MSKALESIDTESALRALLVLSAADRAERQPEPKVSTEGLLSEVGLTNAQIGAIVDEKADTVRKRLERAAPKAPKRQAAKK